MTGLFTVTPNPAIDVTYTVDRQVVGETLRVRDVRRSPGGKGLNVARILAALGRDATAVQPLGGEAGRWMASAIADLGLKAVSCEIRSETRSTVAVVDDVAHPTLLSEPGPTLASDEWRRLAEVLGRAHGGDWVVIAGSFPTGSHAEHLALLVDAAHAAGAFVAVDTSGELLNAAATARADLIKANEREILDATGTTDAREGMVRLARSGAVVVMSRGHRGAVLLDRDGTVLEQPAVPDVVGNPTGAGDAATAGLIAALADRRSPRTALAWATVCGAAAVLSPVAGEIDTTVLPDLAHRLSLPDGTIERLAQERIRP